MSNDHSAKEEWTHWRGGACPIADAALVEVRRRYASNAIGPAKDMCWSHDLYLGYGAEDIVAYRLLAPQLDRLGCEPQ